MAQDNGPKIILLTNLKYHRQTGLLNYGPFHPDMWNITFSHVYKIRGQWLSINRSLGIGESWSRKLFCVRVLPWPTNWKLNIMVHLQSTTSFILSFQPKASNFLNLLFRDKFLVVTFATHNFYSFSSFHSIPFLHRSLTARMWSVVPLPPEVKESSAWACLPTQGSKCGAGKESSVQGSQDTVKL